MKIHKTKIVDVISLSPKQMATVKGGSGSDGMLSETLKVDYEEMTPG